MPSSTPSAGTPLCPTLCRKSFIPHRPRDGAGNRTFGVVIFLFSGTGIAALASSFLWVNLAIYGLSLLPVFPYTWGSTILGFIWMGLFSATGLKLILLAGILMVLAAIFF